MSTTEWKPTPYGRICAEACEWCCKGVPFAGDNSIGGFHFDAEMKFNTGDAKARFKKCTAPSRDEVIERLTAPVVRDKCPVCGDGGCSNCNINLACAELARVTKERELLQERFNSQDAALVSNLQKLAALKQERDELRAQRSEMGIRMFEAERALDSIALNHAEAARAGVVKAQRALNGKFDNAARTAQQEGK